MKEIILQPDETLEDLQLNGLCIIQKKKGFRFGMDAVLLADFAEIKNDDTVADFGTGSGILPILLAGRNKGCFYYLIDIQPELCELAERNMALNQVKSKVLCHDLTNKPDQELPKKIDAIVCNPPYSEPNAALASPDPVKSISRNQTEDTMKGFLRTAFSVLKGKGKLYMIYPAPAMFSIMYLLRQYHLEPKRFRLIYPTIYKAANLVLIEAVKDAKPGLHPQPPLIIRKKGGDLTNELKSIYHMQGSERNEPDSVCEEICCEKE